MHGRERTRSPTPPMPEELRFGSSVRVCVLENGQRSAAAGLAGSSVRAHTLPATLEVRGGEKDGEKDGEKGRRSAAAAIDIEDLLVSAAVMQWGLSEWEGMLIRGCDRALDAGPERTAALCKEARISTAQIEAHAKEIGVRKKLTRDQVKKVNNFVQFMQLLEKMEIIQFEGEVAGRTLLGYDMISVMRQAEWQAAIEATCGFGNCFRAKSTIYEMLLKFGFGGHRDHALPEDAVVLDNSTEKKANVLLYSSTFFFDEAKLGRNLKRYTNSQTRAQPARDGLCALLAAAERE